MAFDVNAARKSGYSDVEIADFLRNSGSDLNYLIGEEFSIDEVNKGLAYLDSGKTGRPLLKLNEV
jgi:hypothetical protein